MSRKKRLNWIAASAFGLLAMTIITVLPAWANEESEKLASEIVYRTNLGRAADVKLLLKQGADPNQADESGVPLLSLAASRRDKEGPRVVKALLEGGADIDVRDASGQTPLFYAARTGNKEMVQLLLERGANYYAVDNSGYIPRTVAYNAGHSDILQQMDDFVRSQSETIKKEYEEYNKALAERYAQEAKMRQQEREQMEKSAQEAVDKALDAYGEAAGGEAMETNDMLVPAPVPVEARDLTEVERLSAELAFYNCAFQYWSFVYATNQTTELSPEELDVAIDSNRDKIVSLNGELMSAHKMGRRYVEHVGKQAKQHIFNRLSAMPSKTYRREHGVGKMNDMQERCTDISRHWQQAPPAVAKQRSWRGGESNKPRKSRLKKLPKPNPPPATPAAKQE